MRLQAVLLALSLATFTAAGQQWSALNSGTSNLLQSVWFTDGQNGWAVGDFGTTIFSTNGGQSWNNANITNQDLEDVTFLNASVGLIVGDDGVILRTVTGGISWTVATSGTSINLRTASFGDGGMAYIGGRDGLILRSVNNGESWTTVETGAVRYRGSAARGTQHAWIVGEGGVIRATTNSGTTWFGQNSGTTSDFHGVFFLNTSEGWAGGQNSTLMYTSNGGASWVPRNAGINQGVDAVFFLNSNDGRAVGDLGTIFKTTNGGLNWLVEASGTTNALNDVFFVAGGQGWIVGDNGTVLFYNGTTSIGDNGEGVPHRTTLRQNYPNPFNPETIISYTVAQPSLVTLRIYNLIGQEVTTIVNTHQDAGNHEVRFDAEGLPSGVYIYKLVLNNGAVVDSRRMTVLK